MTNHETNIVHDDGEDDDDDDVDDDSIVVYIYIYVYVCVPFTDIHKNSAASL